MIFIMNRALYPTCVAVIFASLSLLCGCSTFEHDWEAAASAKPIGRADMTGRWQGTWASEADTHTGGLRCLITRLDDTTYHARYAATFWGIFHFSYEMDLTAKQLPDHVIFEGEADLGAMAGGVYHYEGHADAENYEATYRCSVDHGKFTMKRPE